MPPRGPHAPAAMHTRLLYMPALNLIACTASPLSASASPLRTPLEAESATSITHLLPAYISLPFSLARLFSASGSFQTAGSRSRPTAFRSPCTTRRPCPFREPKACCAGCLDITSQLSCIFTVLLGLICPRTLSRRHMWYYSAD